MLYISDGFNLKAAHMLDDLVAWAGTYNEPLPDYRFASGLKNGGLISVISGGMDKNAQKIEYDRFSLTGAFTPIDARSSTDIPVATMTHGKVTAPVITYALRYEWHESSESSENWYQQTVEELREAFELSLDNHILKGCSTHEIKSFGLVNHQNAHIVRASRSWTEASIQEIINSLFGALEIGPSLINESKRTKPTSVVFPQDIYLKTLTRFIEGTSDNIFDYFIEKNRHGILKKNMALDNRLSGKPGEKLSSVLIFNNSPNSVCVKVPRFLTLESIIPLGLGRKALNCYYSASVPWVDRPSFIVLKIPN